MSQIKLLSGDMTKIPVDAIVNAAHNSLMGGGGIDGVIHRTAGPELLNECLTLGGCETGEVKVTKGYNLPCKYIIHTVGPIWDINELWNPIYANMVKEIFSNQLRNCYFNSMLKANELLCESISFPNISTGNYGFPKYLAADIAISEINKWLELKTGSIKTVNFVCYDEENYNIYFNLLK